VFDAILSRNMRPVYDSAKRQGYEIWKTEGLTNAGILG